jgi:hypothetical protein
MAPGESVWRATFNDKDDYPVKGKKKNDPINEMGKGTSFAAGHVTGAAALWLSAHQKDPELRTLVERGMLTEAFRAALRASAWRPGTDAYPLGTLCENMTWDSNYGVGILDIAALLDVQLSASQTKEFSVLEEGTVPLFASLYPRGTSLERIRRDYRSLFISSRAGSVDELSSFETEILYHYTANEDVQQAIDVLVAAQGRGESADRVRRALLHEDLSGRLRQRLAQ